MEILIFIIIIFVVACKRQVPPGQSAVVRRNGEIIKTYRSGEKFSINPFTDTIEYINNKQKDAYKPNYINPMNHNKTQTSQKDSFSINTSYSFRSADLKNLSVKIYAMFRTRGTTPIATIESIIKKLIITYYSSLNADEISSNATKHELALYDILRDKISNDNIRLEKFEATPSNARITTRNTNNKIDCSHYDNYPKKQYRANDPKYSYSAGNAIKSSLLDTISEQNGNAISSSYDDYSDNPIKDTLNITTLFNTKDMIDIDNMDSNVDPISNK